MENVDVAEAHRVGGVLVLVLPLLVALGAVSVSGGYGTAAFWSAGRDRKLDHIAGRRREWIAMHVGWIAMLAVMTGGLVAFGLLLVHAGDEALAGVGLGLFVLGAVSWLLGVVLQAVPGATAARIRSETGVTPDWLEPVWGAVGWAETAYVALACAAYVVWGVAMIDSGFPATWAGWVSVALGGVSLGGLALVPSRMTFPELPLLVPFVVGVALLLT